MPTNLMLVLALLLIIHNGVGHVGSNRLVLGPDLQKSLSLYHKKLFTYAIVSVVFRLLGSASILAFFISFARTCYLPDRYVEVRTY